MLVEALVLANLFLLYAILNYRYSKIEILKMIALILSLFFSIYSLVAGLYFMIDKFSFEMVLLTQLVCEAIVLIYLLSRYGKKKNGIIFDLKKDIILIALLIVFWCISNEKFELYSTDQDQGLYQAEAIELCMGNYEVQHDFEEYSILTEEENRAEYKAMLKRILGFYTLADRNWPTVESDEIKSDVSGMYHGVQTFPAMLALGGVLFGIDKMVQVQTIFYLCAIILFYYFAEAIGARKIINYLMVIILGLSPLMLWVSKTSFTEMFLTMMMSLYLLFLSENKSKWVLAIPWVAFSFVHVSVLILLPIVVLINLILYVVENRKEYLVANTICAFGLLVGYRMMSFIAPQYFFDNCNRLYYKDIITAENFMMWIVLICAFIICVSWGLCLMKTVAKNAIKERINSLVVSRIIQFLTIAIGIFWIYYGIKIGFVVEEGIGLYAYYGQGIEAFFHLTIYAFSMATGFLLLPVIIFNLIVRTKELLSENNNWIYILLFGWMVLIQSVVFRKEVMYYYYYSRYLVIYIPIICAMGVLCLCRWKKGKIICFSLLSIVAMFIFDYAIITDKDDTVWEWESLLDLEMAIEDNSAIILEKTPQIILGPQLRAVTDAAIFPVFEDFEEEIELLKNNYDRVYFLSEIAEKAFVGETEISANRLGLKYRDKYICSRNAVDPMNGLFPMEIIPVVREFALFEIDSKIEISIDSTQVGVRNGIKSEEGEICSNGENGLVAFGPYISLDEGRYIVRIPIEILKYTNDKIGSFCCYNQQGKNILIEPCNISQCLVNNDGKTYIEAVFELKKKEDNIEFIIKAEAGSVFKISSYTISTTGRALEKKQAEISVLDVKVGVKNSKKENDYIETNGESGTVMFGPYISLGKGVYAIEIPIEIIDYLDDKIGHVTCYNEASKNILLDEINISNCLVENEKGKCIKFIINLQEDEKDVEFVVRAEKGSVFRLFSYTITQLE